VPAAAVRSLVEAVAEEGATLHARIIPKPAALLALRVVAGAA